MKVASFPGFLHFTFHLSVLLNSLNQSHTIAFKTSETDISVFRTLTKSLIDFFNIMELGHPINQDNPLIRAPLIFGKCLHQRVSPYHIWNYKLQRLGSLTPLKTSLLSWTPSLNHCVCSGETDVPTSQGRRRGDSAANCRDWTPNTDLTPATVVTIQNETKGTLITQLSLCGANVQCIPHCHNVVYCWLSSWQTGQKRL